MVQISLTATDGTVHNFNEETFTRHWTGGIDTISCEIDEKTVAFDGDEFFGKIAADAEVLAFVQENFFIRPPMKWREAFGWK